jgi:hypothetical protein
MWWACFICFVSFLFDIFVVLMLWCRTADDILLPPADVTSWDTRRTLRRDGFALRTLRIVPFANL